MEPIRRLLNRSREFLGTMTASQKLLVASLGIIAVMALFLTAQYAGRRTMVELISATEPGMQGTTLAALQRAGVEARVENGKLMVPARQQDYAVSQLAQAGALPDDTTVVFANLLDRQGFYYSKQQNEQMYLIALQNELAKIIRAFRDVRDASVLLDVPEPRGIGRAVRAPTASATVFTASGRALNQGEVDAIAQLIAGARAGLRVENVRVIDGSVGRQRRPTSPDEILATTYLEQTAAAEEKLRNKLSDMLGYIRGVTIAVTAQVDVTRVSRQSTKYLNNKEGTVAVPGRMRSNSTTQSRASSGAEPGVRSNATGSILGGSGGEGGSLLEDSEDETEFEVGLGSETVTEQDPRGMPTMLAASVNIPRSYIVDLIRASSAGAEGGEPAAPTEEEIEARFEQERLKLEASIQPHLTVTGDPDPIPGTVVVSMIPLDVPALAPPESAAGLLGTITGGGMASGGLIEKGLLALLAVGAMGMMLMMVRRATRPAELPTAEELSGVPPTLPTVDDMVGEADESDSAMTGIEVNDDDVRSRKLVEQVTEMITSNPESAAGLIGRWVSEDG